MSGVVPGVLVMSTAAGFPDETDLRLEDIRCVANCRTKSRSATSMVASDGVLRKIRSIYTYTSKTEERIKNDESISIPVSS